MGTFSVFLNIRKCGNEIPVGRSSKCVSNLYSIQALGSKDYLFVLVLRTLLNSVAGHATLPAEG
jgi:hypothetical protein